MADSTPQPSVMQFSLRGLVVIVTCVAIIAGILSPWIRSLEPAQQRRLIESFLFVTGGLVVGLFSLCLQRYRIEQRCGRRHLRLSHQKDSLWFNICVGVSAALLLFSQGLYVVTFREEPAGIYVILRVTWFCSGAFLAGTVTWLWWRSTSFSGELCDHGIIFGVRFYGWQKIKRYRWNEEHDTLSLKTKWKLLEFDVPAEDYADVNRIVQLHLGEPLARSKSILSTNGRDTSDRIFHR